MRTSVCDATGNFWLNGWVNTCSSRSPVRIQNQSKKTSLNGWSHGKVWNRPNSKGDFNNFRACYWVTWNFKSSPYVSFSATINLFQTCLANDLGWRYKFQVDFNLTWNVYQKSIYLTWNFYKKYRYFKSVLCFIYNSSQVMK